MYEQIKKLADDAIKLQNKDRMDAALREIGAMCAPVDVALIAKEEIQILAAIEKQREEIQQSTEKAKKAGKK
tara:strand:+ start:264 stop:479 length:216 start_codon:yes stop_codon:yes gene_type:complete